AVGNTCATVQGMIALMFVAIGLPVSGSMVMERLVNERVAMRFCVAGLKSAVRSQRLKPGAVVSDRPMDELISTEINWAKEALPQTPARRRERPNTFKYFFRITLLVCRDTIKVPMLHKIVPTVHQSSAIQIEKTAPPAAITSRRVAARPTFRMHRDYPRRNTESTGREP